jgi:hypothetical protein
VTEPEFRIAPEPRPDDREAILAAVRELLRQEARRAQPSAWTLAGWTHKRTGISDLKRRFPHPWRMSARLGWGGREFPGLHGRGDAR